MTSYITDINPATPDGSDSIASGDDEIRSLKGMVKSSFPYISGEVSASAAELNLLVGLTDTLITAAGGTLSGTTTFKSRVFIDGADLSISGGIAVSGTIRGNKLESSATASLVFMVAANARFDGTATFSSVPVCNVTPTNDDHLTRKAYVDAAVAGGADPTTVDLARFKNARRKLFFYGQL